MKELFKRMKAKMHELFGTDYGATYEDIVGDYKEPKYIDRDTAIEIADNESNLKKSIYKEARLRGEKYGIVEIYDYYATLVIYNKKYAWYVKVMDGKYGYKQEGEYYTGKLKDKSNIRCLVMAETSEYIFIDSTFNTKQIRMVTDEEYLKFVNSMYE